MLDFLLMMSSLVSTVKFEEEILESRINKSFYLYTAESIDKIRYRDFPHSKNHDSPSIEKISLLSYKNINIDDINIPDFIIQNLYKITYQIIPGLTAKICLLNSSEMPVINVDIFEEEKKSENKFLTCIDFFRHEKGELIDNLKMVFGRTHKKNFFSEHDIYIIEKNELSFDKLKMNIECFEAIHRLKTLKITMNRIKSTSSNVSDKNKRTLIQQCFISFDYFIKNLLSQIINSTYKLHNFDHKTYDSSPDGKQTWEQIVDYYFCLTKIVANCFIIFKDINFTEKYDNSFKQFIISNLEMKKIFNNIVKFYEQDYMKSLIPSNKIEADEDYDETYINISDFLGHYLEFISLIENFIIKSKSSEILSAQEKKDSDSPFISALKWTKEVSSMHFQNLLKYSLSEIKILNHLRSVVLESIIKNCLTVESLFDSLSDIAKNLPYNEPLLNEIFVDFKKNLSKHKEAIFKYKNEIEFILVDMSFEKNTFINEIMFKLQGNNDFNSLTRN